MEKGDSNNIGPSTRRSRQLKSQDWLPYGTTPPPDLKYTLEHIQPKATSTHHKARD